MLTPSIRILVASLLLFAISVTAQVRRRTLNSGSSIAGAYGMPAATIHGSLKRITSKDIIIIVEGAQAMTIDRTHKTKFLKAGKEIKPADIAAGSILTVEVSQDPQLKPLALNVTVDSGPTEPEQQPPSQTSMGSATGSASTGTASPTESKSTPAKPSEAPNQ